MSGTITRRGFLKRSGLVLGGAVLGGAVSKVKGGKVSGERGDRPNVVLILADDMGWSDIGCYGGEIDTPNIDELGYNGLRFSQFHNTAKCFPSRACLLTGKYAQQCGMDKRHGEIKNAVTIGELLKRGGYRTLMAGKHHGTENMYDRGFDRYYGLRDGCCNFFNPGDQRPGEGKPAKKRDRVWCIDEKTYHPYTPEEKDFYTTDYFTNYALDYLEEYKDEDRPFFLYLAYTAPHDPLMAWGEDIAKYEDSYKDGYEPVRAKRYKRQVEMGLIDEKTYPLSEATYKKWEKLSEEERGEESRKMAVYAAMIDRLDQNIGRVVEKLKEIGELENTLIMFASDNGASAEVVRRGENVPGSGEIGSMTRWSSLGRNWANVCNTPFRYYKNYSYEGGICTPFIAYWKGKIAGGRKSEFAAHFIDVLPTLGEICGASYPDKHDGKEIAGPAGISLAPILRGESLESDRAIYWQWARGKAVMKGKWKLVRWGSGPDAWELYDVEKDKTETDDLADRRPGVVEEMARMHEEWVDRCKEG
ncbi:Arylsulfatase [Anaerohalosphaera lusitana]|uniref:Arylsulfatase n=1 Tax=Anaerohalosphaera lusitana TaxID=1936003 RepID=A0A1U9NN17_9BACT|nr:arylsulfatase [Anaerohalosphaera lusitana]AQT69303.1 Arylsulfatase [Anaerohalosphaera lusitana]